jgi:hypothetical protein
MSKAFIDYATEKIIPNTTYLTADKRIRFFSRIAPADATDFSFLNDTKRVFGILGGYKNINTRWNYLMHIMKIAHMNLPEITKKTIVAIEKYASELKPLRVSGLLNNVKNEKQKERLSDITIPEIKNTLTDKIKELFAKYDMPYKVITSAYSKKLSRALKIKFVHDFQEIMYIALYAFQPALRADYHDMKISSTKNIDNKSNWMVIGYGNKFMAMNHFKNEREMGAVDIPLTNSMFALIKIWISALKMILPDKPEYLINYEINSKSVKHIGTDTSLIKAIRRSSEKILDKALSINDYRHMWESAIQNDPAYAKMTLATRDELHHQLLHSSNVALGYNLQDE